MERHLLRFSRSQRDPLKPLQRPNRLSGARPLQTDIELNQLFACTQAGVRDSGLNSQRLLRTRLAAQALIQLPGDERSLADLSRSISKGGVRASVAEGKLRSVLLVDVARHIFRFHKCRRTRQIDLSGWPSSAQGVVIKRFLSNAAWPTYNQFAAGIGFTKQRPSQRRSGLRSRKPCRQHCRHMLKSPWRRERTPAEENKYDRLSGVDDGLEQFLLAPRQPKIRSRGCLPAHIRSLAERENHEIYALGRRDRRRDVLVVAFENPDSPGAQHVAFAQAPR